VPRSQDHGRKGREGVPTARDLQTLEEDETQEGRGVRTGLNRPSETVARVAGSKALKPGLTVPARSSGRRCGGRNGRRASVGENPMRLCGSAEPLKGKSWTRLWDGTSPQGAQRSKPSRAGGTPRTERSEELGAPCIEWTLRVDVAKREPGDPSRCSPRAGRSFGTGWRVRETTAG